MKTKKTIARVFASLLIMVLCFAATNVSAQAKKDSTMMKDCCMMKDGKMMQMKSGKMMPMDKDMTMKDGTKCMTNGECVMKDGKKMKMKDGDCMDMNGKMDKCAMMNKDAKSTTKKKGEKQDISNNQHLPFESRSYKRQSGKCPKCGMELIEKNRSDYSIYQGNSLTEDWSTAELKKIFSIKKL